MPIDLDRNGSFVDEHDPDLQDVFADLQGNILNGHGRDQAVHVLVRFEPSPSSEESRRIRRWIARFASSRVTSAQAQFAASEAFKSNGVDAGLFANFSLSASGYAALGIEERLRPLHPSPRQEDAGRPLPFGFGMADRRQELMDSDEHFDRGYETRIDAMILLAADNPADLIAVEVEVVGSLKEAGATVVAVERGFNLRRRFEDIDKVYGEPVEHFGYADGVSQPAFLKKQFERERRNVGTKYWNPAAPLRLALVPDPAGQPDVSFGSYLVFRKLEQDVRKFRRLERELAEKAGVSRKLAGAMAVGRFEDGTPLVLQPADSGRSFGEKSAVPNDFNYRGDGNGLACPFQAHVRKSNPRLESVGIFAGSRNVELDHRIARRGIPYGGNLNLSENPDELPERGVGLLFMCYQSDLFNQFEFIQRFWCNNRNFLKPGPPDRRDDAGGNYDLTGLDPLIGQRLPGVVDPVLQASDPNEAPAEPPRNWPAGWGQRTVKVPDVDFTDVVRLKGGEYFFAPSLTFLRELG